MKQYFRSSRSKLSLPSHSGWESEELTPRVQSIWDSLKKPKELEELTPSYLWPKSAGDVRFGF